MRALVSGLGGSVGGRRVSTSGNASFALAFEWLPARPTKGAQAVVAVAWLTGVVRAVDHGVSEISIFNQALPPVYVPIGSFCGSSLV